MAITFPVEVTKGKEKATVFHPIDLKGWLDAGWKVAGDEPEQDFDTPMQAYIKSIEDEETSTAFQSKLEGVPLEIKKDGSFTVKTINALDAIVTAIEAD